MSEEAGNDGTSVELDAAKKTLKVTGKKTAEIIAILSMGGLIWMGWVLYTHSTEAKAGTDKLNDGINRMVRAQTEMICLLAVPEKDRESWADKCRRIARNGGER